MWEKSGKEEGLARKIRIKSDLQQSNLQLTNALATVVAVDIVKYFLTKISQKDP
jgi:hypothetical protein